MRLFLTGDNIYLAQSGKLRLVELPLDIPLYFIHQIWHERLMHDPASMVQEDCSRTVPPRIGG
jgi:hypothetical protein